MKKQLKEMYLEGANKVSYRIGGNGVMTIAQELETLYRDGIAGYPDIYGNGEVIESFQKQFAQLFGKQAAVFFPSGTMAQQIMLRIWSDQINCYQVAYHPLCHIEIHEQDGIKELHGIHSNLLGECDRLFNLDDLKSLPDDTATVVFELPQREIGGQLPAWEDLAEMVIYCHRRGFKTHLDGARIFECLPYYKKTLEQVGQLFDSIYVSFYKGLGGVSGAMLIADSQSMSSAKVWKRRHGGDLYHLYPYIISAKNAYDQRGHKMAQYYAGACHYAALLNDVPGLKVVPQTPVSNMFHVYFEGPIEAVLESAIHIMNQHDILLFGNIFKGNNDMYKSEISIGDCYGDIPSDKLKNAVKDFSVHYKKSLTV